MCSTLRRGCKLLGLATALMLHTATEFCYGVESDIAPAKTEAKQEFVPIAFDQAMERGESLLKTKHYNDARLQFDRAISLNPKSGLAYFGRARANRATNKPDAEMADISKGIELSPKELDGRTRLAEILIDKKQYLRGSAEAREVLRQDPSHTRAARLEIAAYIKSQAAPHQDPRFMNKEFETYRYQMQFGKQSRDYFVQGDLVNAMLAATRDLALNVRRTEPMLMRAKIFAAKGDTERAFEEQKAVITSFQSHFLTVDNALDMIKVWTARQDLERAIDLDRIISECASSPNFGQYWLRIRAESLIRRAGNLELANRLPEARGVMLQYVEDSPQQPDSHVVIADWYGKHGELKLAIEEYGIAITLAKHEDYRYSRAEAFLGRAKIREGQGDLHRALADYEGALDADPRMVEAIRGQQRLAENINTSKTGESLKDFKEALGDLEKLISKE